MGSTKMTFTMDEQTVRRIEWTAAQLGIPKSGVVREAVKEYAAVAILLDTSALVDALTGAKTSAPAMRRAHDRGERVILSALVLYEWLRGPRVAEELAAQERFFPRESARPFGPAEAARAAGVCRVVPGARGREVEWPA
jgi:MoxR-like ATPase